MKTKTSILILIICGLSIAASPKLKRNEITVQYSPFAIGAVRLENGIGTIEHPKLDWDSIPVFSLYLPESTPGATITVCWAVSSRMQICSSDPNDNSIYTFAIYDGKAPGVIFPTPQ